MKHLAMVLLGTTLLAAPALAQAPAPGAPGSPSNPATPSNPAGQNNAAPMGGAATTTSPMTTTQPANRAQTNDNKAANAQAETKPAMFEMKPGQWRSSKLVGLNVYNGQNEDIGDINELILNKDGKIEAVVIGVGGFLGIGEHSVAIPYDQVKFSDQPVQGNASTAASGGAAGTTTGSTNAGATTGSTMNNSAAGNASTTGGTSTAMNNNAAAGANARTENRVSPDHAMVNMTKDQLKALPQVKYDR